MPKIKTKQFDINECLKNEKKGFIPHFISQRAELLVWLKMFYKTDTREAYIDKLMKSIDICDKCKKQCLTEHCFVHPEE